MHPLEGGELDVLRTTPGPASTDHLGLVEADDGFSQSVIFFVRVPSEPPGGFRIVVVLTSAGGLSNPRVRPDPVIDPPQADFELDVLFAPYGFDWSRRAN